MDKGLKFISTSALLASDKAELTLTDNCTNGIWMNTRVNPGHPPLSWKILASGYVPEYLHEAGRIAPGTSFDALQRRAHVNARAQAADQAADFSRRIRSGIPGMDPDAVQPIRSGRPPLRPSKNPDESAQRASEP